MEFNTLADKVADLKFNISQIEIEIFHFFGKLLKQAPINQEKSIAWINKNKNLIIRKTDTFIIQKKSVILNEIKRLYKNIAILSIQQADEALNISEQKPKQTIEEVNDKVFDKEVKQIRIKLETLIKRLRFSISNMLNSKNVSQIINAIKKGNDPLKAMDTIIQKESKEKFGTFINKDGMKQSALNVFAESLRGNSLDIYIGSYTKRMQANGKGLVIISQHNDASPMCQPLQGKVFALDIPSMNYGIENKIIPKYYKITKPPEYSSATYKSYNFKKKIRPLLTEARKWITTKKGASIGLMNFKYCRHTFTPYFKNITKKYEKISDEEVEKNRELRKKAIYIQNQITKWGKLKAVSLSKEFEAKNNERVSYWIDQAKKFEKQHNFPVRGIKQKTYGTPSIRILEKMI